MATVLPATFGPLLRHLRLAAGLSQEALAQRAGLSVRAISDLERGARREPYPHTVTRLARALGLAAPDRARLEAAIPRRQRLAAPAGDRPAPRRAPPAALTRLIGRERELAEVRRLLGEARLLTLTGAGGCGKSRLALAAITDLAAASPDGAHWVELAPLADPMLVSAAVAGALGVRETPARPLLDLLADALAGRPRLLALDNCEHLLDACAPLADALLRACPALRVLVTSREPLGIAGEVAWPVPSLAVPPLDGPVELIERAAAVQLFVERAGAAQSAFRLTAANARAVAEICRRLDGIPLAIELAAARLSALTAEQIAARLDDRFRLLTGGGRAAPPRQQTLRAAMDWSHALLTEPEQILLRRLAVFAGGWTLAAAEAVGAGERIAADDVLDLLVHLVAKSLVQVEAPPEGEARYRLLETVRQYAGEKLRATGEETTARDRHAAWCLALAERAQPELFGAEEVAWLARLEAEHDNLRAALAWSLDHDPAAALRFVNGLWAFWWVHNHFAEGARWAARALARAPERSVRRVWALDGAAVLAHQVGGDAASRPLWEESLSLSRELGDRPSSVFALDALGERLIAEDRPRARAMLEEGLAIRREMGEDPTGLGSNLLRLGRLARVEGDYRRARALIEESLTLLRAAGGRWMLCVALADLGNVALAEGDAVRAQGLFEAALAGARELGTKQLIAVYLCDLGDVARWHGDAPGARELYEEGRALARVAEDAEEQARALAGLGRAAELEGDLAGAAALLGESEALFAEQGKALGVAAARRALGRVAWRAGEAERAAALLCASLATCRALGERPGIAECLEGLAAVAAGAGAPARAARLLGAAEALREAMGAPLPPVERAGRDATVAAARAALGDEPFAAARAAGAALTPEAAVAEALADAPAPAPTAARAAPDPDGLTRREAEVLRLIAAGRTNREIAEELALSVRTVERHITNLYGKIDAANRADATAYAFRRALL